MPTIAETFSPDEPTIGTTRDLDMHFFDISIEIISNTFQIRMLKLLESG